MATLSVTDSTSATLSDDFRSVRTIELEHLIGEGGFGQVFTCARINGQIFPSPQVVKIFAPPFAAENYATTARLVEKIRTAPPRTKDEICRAPTLYAIPQFAFRGTFQGASVSGYSANHLQDYLEFEEILAPTSSYRYDYYRWPLATKLRYARQLAEGVKLLRDLNYIHADINPQNIFLSISNQQLALIDFDSGAVTDVRDAQPTTWGKQNEWIAPEIQRQVQQHVQRVHVDLLTDTWSVAIGIYYLLFLFHPFCFLRQFSTTDVARYQTIHRWPNLPAENVNHTQIPAHQQFTQLLETNPALQPLKNRFETTFNDGALKPAMRTSYEQWIDSLKAAEAEAIQDAPAAPQTLQHSSRPATARQPAPVNPVVIRLTPTTRAPVQTMMHAATAPATAASQFPAVMVRRPAQDISPVTVVGAILTLLVVGSLILALVTTRPANPLTGTSPVPPISATPTPHERTVPQVSFAETIHIGRVASTAHSNTTDAWAAPGSFPDVVVRFGSPLFGGPSVQWHGSYTTSASNVCLFIDNLNVPANNGDPLLSNAYADFSIGYLVALDNAVFKNNEMTKTVLLFKTAVGAQPPAHIEQCFPAHLIRTPDQVAQLAGEWEGTFEEPSNAGETRFIMRLEQDANHLTGTSQETYRTGISRSATLDGFIGTDGHATYLTLIKRYPESAVGTSYIARLGEPGQLTGTWLAGLLDGHWWATNRAIASRNEAVHEEPQITDTVIAPTRIAPPDSSVSVESPMPIEPSAPNETSIPEPTASIAPIPTSNNPQATKTDTAMTKRPALQSPKKWRRDHP